MTKDAAGRWEDFGVSITMYRIISESQCINCFVRVRSIQFCDVDITAECRNILLQGLKLYC